MFVNFMHACFAIITTSPQWSGAIIFHLFTPLGVIMPEFNEAGDIVAYDGGLLFGMACLVWLSAAFLTIRDLKSETGVLNKLFNAVFNKGNAL